MSAELGLTLREEQIRRMRERFAARGAEGVGKDVEMIVGNGYARGHAEHALALLRESAALRRLFEERYA